MIVERFATPPLFFHDAGAGLGVGRSPANDPVLEQLVEKVAESFCKGIPASADGETTKAVKNFPDRYRRDAESFDSNRI